MCFAQDSANHDFFFQLLGVASLIFSGIQRWIELLKKWFYSVRTWSNTKVVTFIRLEPKDYYEWSTHWTHGDHMEIDLMDDELLDAWAVDMFMDSEDEDGND